MRAVDAVVTRCVRVAVSRWPQDIRDEQAEEWTAELHAIRRDTSIAAWRRHWERLYFAVTLAASSPYRERTGRTLLMHQLTVLGRRCAMLVAIGVLCGLAQAAPGMMYRTGQHGPGAVYVAGVATVLATALLGLIGYRLGTRQPLSVRPERRFGRLATAAVAMACVGGVVAILTARFGDGSAIEWLMYPVWMVPFLPLLAHVMRLAAKGRAAAAWCWGIGGGLLLCELLAVPLGVGYLLHGGAELSHIDLAGSPLWFPRGVGGEFGAWSAQIGIFDGDPGDTLTGGLSTIIPSVLPATVFLLAYLPRTTRAVVAAASPETAPDPATPRVPQTAALTLCGLAAVSWAAIAALLTPVADRIDHAVPPAWVRDLRFAAILLIAASLAWALLPRARALAPGLLLGIALLAVDIAADRWHLTGAGAFALLAGIAGALVVGAWWLATNLDKRAADATTQRRGLIGLAILAACCAPGVQWQADPLTRGFEHGDVPAPIAMQITTIALMLALTALAVCAANAARVTPLSPVAFVTLLGLPLALLAGTGFLTVTGLPVVPAGIGGLLGLPLAMYTYAIVAWESTPSIRRTSVWVGLTLAIIPAAVLVAYAEGMLGDILNPFLAAPRGQADLELAVASPVSMAGVLPLAALAATLAIQKLQPRLATPGHHAGSVLDHTPRSTPPKRAIADW
ncbi:MAG TPA: hypothetical protein VE172_22680 [Stackebrandtia sp.]|uniref:hypothetical protein n=1 Tax=Stackebrandtia sp. TaxID=2023065 RepID=UPI002D629F55|nr:hypothetical protein [Stackebrandtia sp.]HZE41616.1 hypothetical protein [Stackebrandtia sp.]